MDCCWVQGKTAQQTVLSSPLLIQNPHIIALKGWMTPASQGTGLSIQLWLGQTAETQRLSAELINGWMHKRCLQFQIINCDALNIWLFLIACVCGFMHISTGAHGGQERASNPLKLEPQVVVSHLLWVPVPNSRPLQEHMLSNYWHHSIPYNVIFTFVF